MQPTNLCLASAGDSTTSLPEFWMQNQIVCQRYNTMILISRIYKDRFAGRCTPRGIPGNNYLRGRSYGRKGWGNIGCSVSCRQCLSRIPGDVRFGLAGRKAVGHKHLKKNCTRLPKKAQSWLTPEYASTCFRPQTPDVPEVIPSSMPNMVCYSARNAAITPTHTLHVLVSYMPHEDMNGDL